VNCARHPDIETNLRCGKCETPICPKCMVQTPIGARCPDCARSYRLPTYRVSGSHYVRAIFTALGAAIVCGILWGLLVDFIPLAYIFNIFIAAGVGEGCAELIGLSVNRKRGAGLAVIAAIAVLVANIIALLLSWPVLVTLFDILAIAAGIFVAVTRIR
jgi:hypothetical protein